MADKKIKAHYVVSTHWDREWYETFQQFRYHLVELLDEVIDTMRADEHFACFQTDGQSIILEDYLEIRPERESLVRDYARAGRFRIGPWYTMPDENIVAPESLIRNLEEGIRVARDFGNVSKVGFVCDIFGHVSQLPQIFRGFDIDTAYVFRGVNEDTHTGVFRWRAADGSEVVTLQFGPKDGYFDLAAQVRHGFDQDKPFVLDDAIQRLSDYVNLQQKRTGLDTILLFDGGDHMPIEPQTVAMLEGLRKLRPDVDVAITGLDEFSAALVAHRDQIKTLDQGELRNPGRLPNDGTWLIPGVLSSRIRLKQDNRARETELCFWAEPFSHYASALLAAEYPYSYIRRAWRYILENHAHDSICGCSPDQVHRDMEFRFDQARMISGKVIDTALRGIATRVELPDLKDEEFAMVVFNPSQTDVNGPVDLELWFDEKTKSTYAEFFNYESKVGFRLFDAEGQEIPYDYVSYVPRRRRYHRAPRRAPRGQECLVVTVTTPLTIPAFGYTTITCKPEASFTRHPDRGLLVGDRAMENEHLRVEVNPNGSLKLTDKRSKQVYDRLLVFEERADIGDGWFHGVAVNDRIFSSTAAAADVAVIAAGGQKAVLRITNHLHVPRCFEFDTKMCRSDDTVLLKITSDVTLRAGADHLEITTVIDNNVRDHRVRVLFETGASTDTYLADSAFDMVERKIALPAENHTYRELVVETAPHASWTAVHDKQRGLAVVAPDLPETAVRDVPERTLALTLLRGFRRTVFRSDDEIGGQSLCRHEFKYRLVPLQGRPDVSQLSRLGQQAGAGLRAVQVLPRDQAPPADRKLDRTASQFSINPGKAIVTSFRRHPQKQHLEVRMFNPTSDAITETLTLSQAPRLAQLVNLEGEPSDKLECRDNKVTVKLAPRQIVTVALDVAS